MLESFVELNVPLKPRRVIKKPVWMTREVTRAIRRGLWKRAKCVQEMAKYMEAEKDATKKIRNAKRNFEKKQARENHGNSRPVYAYSKGKTKSRSTSGPLKDSQNVTVAGEVEMANLLINYFASVFAKEGDGEMPEEEGIKARAELGCSQITENKIIDKIKELRPNSALGPDKSGPGPLLPGVLFLGRRTQNRPNKNPSGLGNLQPRNWPNSKNAA